METNLTWAEWLALVLVAVFVLLPVLAWRAFAEVLTRVRLYWSH
jgi:hypothetical protein